MLKIPVIWIVMFGIIICSMCLSFFSPTLADHLASFNLSATYVGLMFLLCQGCYAIVAPIFGILIDRWKCGKLMMLIGSIGTAIAMLLIGPSPLLNLEKNLILIGLSLAILGVSAALLYIPSLKNCLDATKWVLARVLQYNHTLENTVMAIHPKLMDVYLE